MNQKPRYTTWVAALAAATFAVAGCGDDDVTIAGPVGDGGTEDQSDAQSSDDRTDDPSSADTNTESSNGSDTVTRADGGTEVDSGTGGGDDSGSGDDSGAGGGDEPTCRTLPSVLTLSGCAGLGPLCSVNLAQADPGECPSSFTANCNGALLDGTLDGESGAFTLSGELAGAAATTEVACEGGVQRNGTFAAECVQTPAEGEPVECSLEMDGNDLPGLSCLELPQRLDGLVFTEQGVSNGATVDAGSCSVVQAGCDFQAQCDDVTFSGSVSADGISFSVPLAAVADAQTPDPTESSPNPEPAFTAGDEVNHSCTATLSGDELSGSCSAGGVGRRSNAKPATSWYDVASSVSGLPDSCELLAPSAERLFVLDACQAMKEGEGDRPGIGEPICAFRQNNCVWEVQCGDDIRFSGRLPADETQLEWRLASGTPCEASFDAEGNFSGSCTVQGEQACELASKDAAPAEPALCEQIPGPTVSSHGCGGGTSIECSQILQNGCDFMGICEFGATRFPGLIVTGELSREDGRDTMSFNGARNYECSVQKVLDEEIGEVLRNGDTIRAENEWYGTCSIENPDGSVGSCRDAGSFHGFRLFFGEPACGAGGPECTPEQLGLDEDDVPVEPPAHCRLLPEVLSVSGCAGVGPLCTVELSQAPEGVCPSEFTANCNGTMFEGTLDGESGAFAFDGELSTSNASTGAVACEGTVQRDHQLSAACLQTPASGEPTECTLEIAANPLPGLTCMELPSSFDALTFVEQGAPSGAEPFEAGACSVVQAGCTFQAECDGDVTLSGSVTEDGASFTLPLVAVADAQTADATDSNPEPAPAFLTGETVNHSCTTTLVEGQLSGTCSAGGVGRRSDAKPATSWYDVTSGVSGEPEACALLAPEDEHLFVLDSCDILKDGEGGQPGIGEPICSFRQNNCVWEVQCGDDIRFSRRLEPGATRFEWRLDTGTPCEARFDAEGNLTGSCTVPGEQACELSSKPAAAPNPALCAEIPDQPVSSHGCGGGTSIECSKLLQHGCDFMGICEFGATRFPGLIVTGAVTREDDRDTMSFNGARGYECSVQKVLDEEIGEVLRNGGTIRTENEWYGTCSIENPDGSVGSCRDAGSFHGFRLFFGEPACGAGGPECTPEQLAQP